MLLMASATSLSSSKLPSGVFNLPLPTHSFLTTFPPPSTRRRHHLRLRRPPIVSEMQPEKNESTPAIHGDTMSKLSSGDQNSIAPTSTNSGQNLQFISLANTPAWTKLVLAGVGVILAIAFRGKALKIKDATKAVEEVAEMVEVLAEVTEKAAEEIGEVLPDGSLKRAALRLEKIAFLVDKHAEITESLITKIDDAVEVLDTALKHTEEEKGKAAAASMEAATESVEAAPATMISSTAITSKSIE